MQPPLRGRLVCHGDGQFVVFEDGGLSAFWLETFVGEETIARLEDNVRFAHPDVTAQCDAVSPNSDGQPKTLIFVCGSREEK